MNELLELGIGVGAIVYPLLFIIFYSVIKETRGNDPTDIRKDGERRVTAYCIVITQTIIMVTFLPLIIVVMIGSRLQTVRGKIVSAILWPFERKDD